MTSNAKASLFGHYKPHQFELRGVKARMAAAQADLNLLYEQNARIVNVLSTAEMDVHLNSEFRLITRMA